MSHCQSSLLQLPTLLPLTNHWMQTHKHQPNLKSNLSQVGSPNPSTPSTFKGLPDITSLPFPHTDKARDRSTGEIVALKKVRFDRCRDGVPVTSIRELRVLQSCSHPSIVQLKKVVTGSKADRWVLYQQIATTVQLLRWL